VETNQQSHYLAAECVPFCVTQLWTQIIDRPVDLHCNVCYDALSAVSLALCTKRVKWTLCVRSCLFANIFVYKTTCSFYPQIAKGCIRRRFFSLVVQDRVGVFVLLVSYGRQVGEQQTQRKGFHQMRRERNGSVCPIPRLMLKKNGFRFIII